MAWSFAAAPSSPFPTAYLRFQVAQGPATKNNSAVLIKPVSSEKHLRYCKAAAHSEGVAEEEDAATGSSARTQLDLLEQLTSSTSSSSGNYASDDNNTARPTVREQLSQLVAGRDDDLIVPLVGKKFRASVNSLTVSQKRNIKRQAYLNEVSRRNDSVFFATIGAFVILPPVIILSVAILTGYVQLFP